MSKETIKRYVITRKDLDLIGEKGLDLPTKYIEVPEWAKALGVPEDQEAVVKIRTLTGTERDSYEGSLSTQRGANRQLNLHNARAKLVALCMIDEEGKRLFNDHEINVLGKRSAAALDRLWDACRELSGLTKEAVDQLTEELAESPNS